jgi:hypothetical protein
MTEKKAKTNTETTRDLVRGPGAEWRMTTRTGAGKVEHTGEGTFDELTVDQWLHIEQLEERVWWMRVGDARVEVSIETDGSTTVDIQRGFYDDIQGRTTDYCGDE